MTLNIELKKILSTFESIKQELSASVATSHSLSFKEAQNQLSVREIQLKTVLEISEKLINDFFTKSVANTTVELVQSQTRDELIQKYSKLMSQYETAEAAARFYREDLLACKAENERLTKSVGNNNLFSVEVYESEIQDLKKEFKEKVDEMQSKEYLEKVEKLELTNSHKKFIEIQNKYLIVKDQSHGYKKKIEELEDVIRKNHEHKKATEKKYFELVNTHKKMFSYIEKLEVKVKKFQDKHTKSHNFTSDSLSRENSLSFYSRVTDESRSISLSISGPVMVFSL